MTDKTSQDVQQDDTQNRAKNRGDDRQPDQPQKPVDPSVEVGGPKGPEPTRFGDWEKGGRCTDF